MDEYFNKIRAIFPLSCDADVFIGRTALAVFFGEETVAVKTRKQVFTAILIRCNQECRENLMYLRGKTSGKVRLFLSDKPDGMRNPVKLDDELYTESGNYGAATMIHICVTAFWRRRSLTIPVFVSRFDNQNSHICPYSLHYI
jgi:hypothetical protein